MITTKAQHKDYTRIQGSLHKIDCHLVHSRYLSDKDIQSTFGFLNNIPSIPIQDLHTGAANLQKKYAADLEEDFVDEIGQFRENENTLARPKLQLIREGKLQSVFANVDVAFQLFATSPATHASKEHSFKTGISKKKNK